MLRRCTFSPFLSREPKRSSRSSSTTRRSASRPRAQSGGAPVRRLDRAQLLGGRNVSTSAGNGRLPDTTSSEAVRALVRILAMEVFPVPRGPAKRYPCRTWSCSIALRSVRTTASSPTTSSKPCGRYLRYSAVTRAILECPRLRSAVSAAAFCDQHRREASRRG
jgi:hypothetical protein